MPINTLTHYTTEQIKNPILLAEHFAKSGYFKDASDISKAVVKIIAGQELGFGPMASMAGFHVIQGKPTLSSNLMAAAIKRSGKYNFRVRELTDQVCIIDFTEEGKDCGTSTFTIEDAKKAGTQNLAKFPKNMLYARALSNGAKWFCPDILNGSPIYTPEELGANVDEEGEIIAEEPKIPEIRYITENQLKLLLKQLLPQLSKLNGETSESIQQAICSRNNVPVITELTTAQADKLIEGIKAKILELESESTNTQDIEVAESTDTALINDQPIATNP